MRANVLWKFESDAPISKVAAADGVFAGDERHRLTLLGANGKVVWTHASAETIRAVRTTADGRTGFLLAIRELSRFGQTGKPVWSIAPPPLPVDLAVRRDGSAIAVAAEQGLVKVYAANGKEQHARRVFHQADFVATPDLPKARRRAGGRAPWEPAEPAETQLLVVSRRGDVTALGGPMCEPLWHVNLGCEAWRPDCGDDRVFIPTFDGVHALLLDGTPAGLYDVNAPCYRAQSALGGALLLVQDIRRRILLLDAKTSDVLWNVELTGEPRDVSLSEDGRCLAIATVDGAVECFELSALKGVAGETSSGVVSPPPAHARPAGYLEMEGEAAAKVQPRLRWRAKTPAISAAEIAVVKGGVVLLDPEAGVVSFWTGGSEPAWTAGGVGSGALLGAARVGHPIVAAGQRGLRFFAADGDLLAESDVVAKHLAVADSGLAVLVGSDVARLHLYDGTGRALWDVPTKGFSEIGISPRGMEIALAQPDGQLTFHVRGQRGSWTSDLTPEAASDVRVLPRPPIGFRETPLLHAEPDARIVVLDDGVAFGTRSGRAGFVAPDGKIVFEKKTPPIEEVVRAGRAVVLRDAEGVWHRLLRDPWDVVPVPTNRSPGAVSRFAEAGSPVDSLLEFRYDSKEICCLDAGHGGVLWRRAVDSRPLALAVADDGLSLAAHVAGELVCYDLTAAPTGAAPRFLEL